MSNTLFKLKRSAVKGKSPVTTNIELGELAINTNDGRLFFKTTDSASSSSIVTLREISGGTGITETNGVVSITDTGTSTGEFGSSTQIPVLTVNAQGQITAIDETAVAGVSALAFDSANATLTISTADGGSFNARIGLSAFSTTDLSEGTNLYYTTARADSDFDIRLATKTTDNLTQGSTNLYYASSLFDTDLATKTTDNLTQGSVNLYYDSARTIATARHSLSATGNISYNATTGVISYTDVPYAGFDSDFATKTTNDLTEGGSTNLYFNNSRARSAVSATDAGGDGSFSYDSATGIFSYTGPSATETRAHFSAGTGIGITNGQISTSITQYTDALARSSISTSNADAGFGGISYNSSTGVVSLNRTDSADVRSVFSATGDLTYNSGTGEFAVTTYKDSDARNVIGVNNNGTGYGSIGYNSGTGIVTYNKVTAQNIRDQFSVTGDIAYDSATGQLSVTKYTDTEARSAISVTDAGGDGSLSYNNGTGVVTYTGPSATETRAHFTGGTGVTITNGSVAIAQSVGTTDDVVFGKVSVDSAQIGCLHFDKKETAPNSLAGLLYYDSNPQKGLSFQPTTNELVQDVSINLGQEHLIYVHNLTGAQIDNGDAVYVSGTAHGIHPQISLAKADASGTANVTGIATMDIPNGNHGYVTQFGLVNGLNTLGMTQGAFAYLSADSAGKWSTTEVSIDQGYPTHVGRVISVDGVTGSLLVNIEKEHAEYLRVEDRMIVDGKITADSGDFKLLNVDISSYSDIDVPNNLPAFREGNIFYQQGPDALVYSNSSINVKVGQDEIMRVFNNSGSSIPKGKVVYVTGAANDFPTIGLAKSDNFSTTYTTSGLASSTIANGAYGYVTVRGLYGGLNTASFNVGDLLHVSPDSAGEMVSFSPDYPNWPYQIGTVLVSDSATGGNVGGCIQINLAPEIAENIRVQGNQRVDGDVTIAGNLNILGSETTTTVQSLNVGDQFIYVGAGDTIETVFGAGLSGLNDATFKEYYEGDSDRTYFVKITGTDSAGDTIQWGFDSASGVGEFTPLSFDSDGGTGPTSWNLGVDNTLIPLRYNVKLTFSSPTGHTVNNYWKGDAQPINQDFGLVGNYNTVDAPYTHAGVFRDTTDSRWKFFNKYDPEVGGNINTSDASFELADLQVNRVYGNVTGAVTGNASTASSLLTSRTIAITGDVTGTATSFDGTNDITITAGITANTIVNADINASAAIADTKLGTISTAGKVQNSATTATPNNTASTIVARNGSGNFSAGTITASLTGNVTGQVSDLSNQTSTIRGLFSVDSSGLGYNSSTGQFSLANPGVDSTSTLALFSAANSGTGYGTLSYSNGEFSFAKVTNANVRSAISAGTGINISSGQISTTITQYTDTDARAAVSVNDAGGDGSLSYDNGTGILTYTGPSATETRAHFSAGTGIGISNGQISTTITQYTDTLTRNAISVTNAGTGFGSLGYNPTNGAITYNKVTAQNIRDQFSVTGDISYSAATGEFSVDETYSTANELLTAVKTVDGSGSGLDADKLDNQQGSYYRINVYNSAGTLLN